MAAGDDEIQEFFVFSNPLFLDGFVAIVLYIVYRLSRSKFPRVSEGIKEASLIFLVFMCYDTSRFLALDEANQAISNAMKLISFEKKTHLNFEIPLQRLIVQHVSFTKFINNFYLAAHWGGLVLFYVWAFSRVIFSPPNKADRRRREYVTARGRFIIMNMLAFIGFMAFPCAPPRVIGGYIDTLNSVSHTDVYTNTRRFVNPFAAMPSMHQGYSLLFACTVVIMLRSEILSSCTEMDNEDECDNDIEALKSSSNNDSPITTRVQLMRSYMGQIYQKYNRYQLLSHSTRQNPQKLFLISLLPFVFLGYPIFMFFVIVGTGNHFVMDAIAGACTCLLAVILFPIVTWLMECAAKGWALFLKHGEGMARYSWKSGVVRMDDDFATPKGEEGKWVLLGNVSEAV